MRRASTGIPGFTLPPHYARIKVVSSFEELVTTSFEADVNALCWQRTLPGNFNEVVQRLATRDAMTTVDESHLGSLPLSVAGAMARDVLLEDLRLLHGLGLDPVLNCIEGYPRDDDRIIATDVYSFHVDSAPVATDTYLCSYTGAASEGLRNDQARRRVDIPETRAELLKAFGGQDNAEFHEYLAEHCYDLHYAPLPQAEPFSFGLGNLWRIATQYPGSLVPPCFHRAPATLPGRTPRLLLIS